MNSIRLLTNSSPFINRFKLTEKLTIGNLDHIDLFVRPYLHIYLGYYEKEDLIRKRLVCGGRKHSLTIH